MAINNISTFFPRHKELATLNDFISGTGSGLTYLRGRRRIGKSTLLKHLTNSRKDTFYFQGLPDANDLKLKKEFALRYSAFSKSTYLNDIKTEKLTWPLIFSYIRKVATESNSPIIIILDEVQWISKSQSGFLGYFKEAWLDWHETGLIKVIISGSSNKFFTKNISHTDAPLRGLSTFSDIWVSPFTLKEIAKYYFPSWTKEEVCLVDMMLGGIPYYLELIPKQTNFILAINEAIFQQKTIFLSEIDEILNLEFSQVSLRNIKLILSVIGLYGATEKKIVEITGLPQSSISDQIKKLLEYRIIEEQIDILAIKKNNRRGTEYLLSDPYLIFYFQILQSYTERIKQNRKGLLFNQLIKSKTGYYIENFTGRSFENLIKRILNDRSHSEARIFKKLGLVSPEYQVSSYCDSLAQFDIIVDSEEDRELRIIEVKWISGKEKVDSKLIEEFANKSIEKLTTTNRKISKHLCLSLEYHKNLEEQGKKLGVNIIFIEDLF